MPVGTVAEAMVIDAYDKHVKPKDEPVLTMLDNSGIYRTVEVR